MRDKSSPMLKTKKLKTNTKLGPAGRERSYICTITACNGAAAEKEHSSRLVGHHPSFHEATDSI